MKLPITKYSCIVLFAAGVSVLQSCDQGFAGLNTNPDAVSKPTPGYIFSKALYDGTQYSGNTETLLLGMMILVAKLKLSGFFRLVNGLIVRRARHPLVLLVAVVWV